MVVQTTDGRSLSIEGPKMRRALQYLPTAGLPELVTWLKKLQVKITHSLEILYSNITDIKTKKCFFFGNYKSNYICITPSKL
jgi:hypothetical protein